MTFLLTLEDPCDPPNSVSGVDLTNQDYTLTASEKSYIHSAFTIDPDYCLLDYTYAATSLQAGDSAILQYVPVENKFLFHYDKDLLPLGQTQTVTVTATSNSKYTVVNTKKDDFRTFDLTFNNPCIDQAFVNILPPNPSI